MNINDLKPASTFAQRNGVKSIIFGGAGGGKTPTINTAPRPLMLACEPGMLSMRGSMVPTYQAHDAVTVNGFFDWFFGSNETKNFDTFCLDSASQLCEIYLTKAKAENKHGLQAYGQMAEDALKQLNRLFFMPQKHMYIIAKQELVMQGGYEFRRPYYPGKQLPVEMPHKYDQILHLDIHNVPNVGQVKSFQCVGSIDTMARDRSGMLAEFEQPDFGAIVKKVMQ